MKVRIDRIISKQMNGMPGREIEFVLATEHYSAPNVAQVTGMNNPVIPKELIDFTEQYVQKVTKQFSPAAISHSENSVMIIWISDIDYEKLDVDLNVNNTYIIKFEKGAIKISRVI